MHLDDIKEAANGRWYDILQRLGVPKEALSKIHTRCPFCGGKDRYRWTDRDGDGWYFCNQCGSGDGFKLLQKYNGWNFSRALDEVTAICGGIGQGKKEAVADFKKERAALWSASAPITEGDASYNYLKARIGPTFQCPSKKAIRTAPAQRHGFAASFPCMVGVVCDDSGRPVTLHRTWLQGAQKAPLDCPRRLMKGPFPPGGAIRLFEAGEVLGVAEGIETALAAACLHKIPVWSLISAENMRKFRPPSEVKKLVIFGDSDSSYTGQAVAYDLARRLVAMARMGERQLAVEVRLPMGLDTDWCDVAKSAESDGA